MTTENKITKTEIINKIAELWEPLTEDARRLLIENVEIKKVRKNDYIYKFHEAPRQMICLIKGKIKVYKDGINRRNQIIRVVKPTDFLGYRAFFADEDYRTAAKAIETCIIASFPMHIIMDIMKENPNVSIFFIRHLSVILGVMDQRIIDLTQKHVRGRLADALLFLKDNYGLENDEMTLNVYLSRKELASLSNMTTSNAIRTLSSFVSEKIVSTDGRKIRIIDEQQLKRISALG